MSDDIKHECGIAFLRLRKPLEFYLEKYGKPAYGAEKMYLLMEKQHNRGQDGAGVACVKIGVPVGKEYMNRSRSNTSTPIIDTFRKIFDPMKELQQKQSPRFYDMEWLRENMPFIGDLFLGHLRYGTFGKNDIENTHPQLRHNNWKTRTIALAGNFNLTNVNKLIEKLISYGQHPVNTSDTFTMLEKIGYFLDEANNDLYQKYKAQGLPKIEISRRIAEELDVTEILNKATKHWDGGYVISGLIGHGDGFVMRDPAGIRPAFYYANDEIVVVTSERPVIQTAFNIPFEDIKELDPGHALISKADGSFSIKSFKNPIEKKACSFERIYFSRGTDADIYHERKKLGRLITPSVLKAIDYDIENTVFSYIPNTAMVAFMGMYAELDRFADSLKKDKLVQMKDQLTPDVIDSILRFHPRAETIAVKDMKHRTFITQDKDRDELVTHIYDVTYGLVRSGIDKVVVIDDSIVRGTTLRQSIIKMLDRLEPTEIVIASSAPQIRYPDCYGIDMAKLGDFIAFRAAVELLKETRQSHILDEVYTLCKKQEGLPDTEIKNYVKMIYKPFTAERISEKIAEMVTPPKIKAKVKVVFQTIEDLHAAMPANSGDWYFTGDFPTPGGFRVVNRSFLNYMEGKNERAY